jgi:hypothetical protein
MDNKNNPVPAETMNWVFNSCQWTTEITINGELEYSEKLTIEQIEKLQKFIREELK